MPDPTPISLAPVLIDLDSPEFQAIANWTFSDAFVGRLLRTDIPQRLRFGRCSMWAYRDPDEQLVGFGTLDLCYEYATETAGRIHPYIPLLAVRQASEGRKYAQFIVRHLSDEATLLALTDVCADVLYLDVYTTSHAAIHIYKKCGFAPTGDEPLPDPTEGGLTYIVMARRTKFIRGGVPLSITGG